MIVLWLDDMRNPEMPNWSVRYWLPEDCIWVKSYEEFKRYIDTNWLPDIIYFDHDLSDEHVVTMRDEYMSWKWNSDMEWYKEKTWYDAMKYLVEYCISKQKKIPICYSQSANPAWKENILALYNNFIKHYEQR